MYGQFIAKSGVAAAGALSGGNFLIDSGTLPRDNPKNITFDGTNYLVSFIEEKTLPSACPSSGCTWEAFGLLVSKNGAPLGSKFVIGNTTARSKIFPVPVYLGTKYLVTWRDGYGTISPNIKGQYVSTSGALDGAEFTLFSAPSSGAVPWGNLVFTGGGVTLAVTDWATPDAIDSSTYSYTSTDVTGSILTVSGSDTTPPSVPTGVSATASSSTQINLTWSAATDNVGVTGYKVYRSGTLIGSPTATSYNDTGLTASSSYSYTVAACDAANNCSAQSSAASATTLTGVATLSLITGWNLVGNSVNAPLDVATTLADASKVTSVWKWVSTGAGKWAFFSPALTGQALSDYAVGKGYDVLTTINGGDGFWVNAKTAFTAQLPVGAAVTSTSFQTMAFGWHLIATGDTKTPSGFNTDLSVTPPTAGVVPQNITTLWAWDSALSKWYFYASSLEAQGGTALSDYITSHGYLDFTAANKTLGPGVGFWVNMP